MATKLQISGNAQAGYDVQLFAPAVWAVCGGDLIAAGHPLVQGAARSKTTAANLILTWHVRSLQDAYAVIEEMRGGLAGIVLSLPEAEVSLEETEI